MPGPLPSVFLALLRRLEVPTTVYCDCLGVAQGMQALLKGQSVRRREHWDLGGPIEQAIKLPPDKTMLEVESYDAGTHNGKTTVALRCRVPDTFHSPQYM